MRTHLSGKVTTLNDHVRNEFADDRESSFITFPQDLKVLYDITYRKTLFESNIVLWVLDQKAYK